MLVIGCKRYDDKEGFMSKIMSKIVMVFVVMNLIGIAVALFWKVVWEVILLGYCVMESDIHF